jgi:hypothetical protein
LASLLRASLQSLGDNQPPSGSITFVPDSVRPIRSSNSRDFNQTPQSKPQSQSNQGGPRP